MSTLNIKATSGGIRGQENSGQFFNYRIEKDTFTALCGDVFDLCVKNAGEDNKKSGGHVSQMLHAYGVTADRLEKYGEQVFPAVKFKGVHPDGGETKVFDTLAELEENLGERFSAFAVEEIPQTWNDKNTEAWMEAMNFKAKRGQKPLEERQAEWDAKAATLIAAGLNPADYLSPKQRPVK